MEPTRDSDEWFELDAPDTEEEQDDLLDVLRDITKGSFYEAKRDGDRVIVSGPSGRLLILENEKARRTFIGDVEKLKVEYDLDAALRRNLENPHA